MPDNDDELLDDEDLEDDEDATGTNSDDDSDDSDQPELTLEQVLARVEALETSTAAHRRDIVAATGRLQSLQTKIDAGDDSSKTLRELRAAQQSADAALEAILEDEAIDPATKGKVAAAKRTATSDAEKQELLDRLDALEGKGKTQSQQNDDIPQVSVFEQEIWTMIESFGLKVNDPAFDWKGEATKVLTEQGEAATRKYFTSKIRELLEDDKSGDRRQMRKRAAGNQEKAPSASTLTKELDESRPIKDRLAHLRSLGAI